MTKFPLRIHRGFERLQEFLGGESGQDLIEYALLFGLVVLAAAASMTEVTAQINSIFGAVGTKLSTYAT